MNYDSVYKLVEEIQETPEYKEYRKTREAAFSNDLNSAMLQELKRLQWTAQAETLSRGQVDELTGKRLQKLGETLQFNPKAAEYLLAEYNFNHLLNDVYKILAEGVGVTLEPTED